MATITVAFDTKQTQRAFDRLKEKAPKAIARALNRSIASAKTVMSREISQDLGLPVAKVKDGIRVENATPDRPIARLYASRKPVRLYAFGARQTRSGVTAHTRGRQYPHAFIATMQSGHVGVFRRYAGVPVRSRNPKRQGIREVMEPPIAYIFIKHVAVGLARGLEQLAKNLNSEFRFALRETA